MMCKYVNVCEYVCVCVGFSAHQYRCDTLVCAYVCATFSAICNYVYVSVYVCECTRLYPPVKLRFS